MIVLFAAACGGAVETASTSGDLAICQNDANVDWLEEPVNGVTVSFDQTVYRAGETATFDWDVQEGLEVIVGDEWLVDCWDGEQAHVVWQTNRVFSENPESILTGVGLGTEDDGWEPEPGAIPIPEEAPPGFYTAVVDGVVVDAAGTNLGVATFEASFLVVR